MTADAREVAWQSVERLFAESGIAVGSTFPVILGISVRKENVIPSLQHALTRADLETIEVIEKKRLFGRRWLVAARSKPRPIAHADIDRWLDAIEPILADSEAQLATWFPLVPDELVSGQG